MAGYIPEHIVREIESTVDILDVISEFVQLKKTGSEYLGLCPFHSEKTPSFTVNPDKGVFYCFGCGVGGNVFSFLMKLERMTFPEVAKMLARRCGVRIPENTLSREQQRRIAQKERLYTINQYARDYYAECLSASWAAAANHYLMHKREILPKTIENFGIGFAPPGWSNLMDAFSAKGVTVKDLERAGLVVRNKKATGYYDRFRNRIMFPIIDIRSRIIGFGGRVMDDATPKYLNSPETPIYNKSRSLYGIHLARESARQTGILYLVEGYLDVILLHQHGIPNVVATLGTALTQDHARLIKGYAQRVILVYDADEAGLRAAQRVEGILRADVDVLISSLPPGEDPDSYVRKHGKDAFIRQMEQAKSIFSFRLNRALEMHGVSAQAKVRIVSEMKPFLAGVSDPVARTIYAKELADKLGIHEEVLLKDLHRGQQQKHSGQMTLTDGQKAKNRVSGSGVVEYGQDRFYNKTVRWERRIIAMMLQYPPVRELIGKRQVLDRFQDQSLKKIGYELVHVAGSETDPGITRILDRLEDDATRNLVAALAMEKHSWTDEGCRRLIAQFESQWEKFMWRKQLKTATDTEKEAQNLLLKANEKLYQIRKRQMNNLEHSGGLGK